MDTYSKLDELFYRNNLIKQKLLGIGIALAGIGMQIFGNDIHFILVTGIVICIGLYILNMNTLFEEVE